MFDRTNPTDLAALKSEVTTDPNGYGYEPANTFQVLGLINETRGTITVTKSRISAAAVKAACTYDAYDTLAIDEQEWLRWMTEGASANEETMQVTTDLRDRLADPDGDGTASIWAAAHRTAMNAAMAAIIDVDGSRAEELFGYGTNISRDDWLAARDS